MKTPDKFKDSKRGKQNENLISHKPASGPLFQAHRLEGKVKNLGIKNIGHQKKKEPQGDR